MDAGALLGQVRMMQQAGRAANLANMAVNGGPRKGQGKGRGKGRGKGGRQSGEQGADQGLGGGRRLNEEAAEEDPIIGTRLDKQLSVEIRMAFVRKVYAILAIQLCLTTAIAAPLQRQTPLWLKEHTPLLLAATLGVLACWLATCCCRRALRSYPWNWVYLLFFTSCKGVVLGFLCARYPPQAVLLAVGITASVFLAMTCYAFLTKTDFTGFAPYFAAAWFVFAIFGLALTVMHFCGVHIDWLTTLFDALGVLLFTAYIVFDTQRILGEWGGHQLQFSVDDYVFAAMALYRDIIHLFVRAQSPGSGQNFRSLRHQAGRRPSLAVRVTSCFSKCLKRSWNLSASRVQE